ncbi:MAG: bifunctional (p)ppGpp synthetase/guanosine-3',5'-bis(diphosphate) 3'-pyrophosphohydrolase [Clostridia bacterium]|nr:bifunctional (p)ppGpp synthetase/guanosine-3',5'-bis(diphosphate) 3'-pyrophosphohydrolase [Clostridia bacterium]
MSQDYQKLLEKIKKYNPNVDENLLKGAYDYAREAHGNQLRKSGELFFSHPYEVANILAELEMDCESIAAGLLHDVIEDTEHSQREIREKFGEDVAMLVEGVTKLEKIPFTSKEQQQIENLRKMFLAMASDVRVIIIKLADRLHNMRTLKSMSDEKQREKAKETLDVFAPLAHRLGISRIKWELEDLALRYLDPIAYYEIVESISQKKNERDQYISDVISSVTDKIKELGITAQVMGRAKHFYSIFRKMYAQNKGIDEIYDLFAVRVIVNSIAECYAVLGLVHESYKPIPGRFKDYIAMPKPNMYQSLHTTVIGPNGSPFEIQIRTWDMHRTAEYGIAAHWKYKEGNFADGKLDDKLEWIRKMLDVQNDLGTGDTEEFMKTLKIDLFSDEVFVFTPHGDVINLPAGSCPIDFAYAIHSEVGNKMIGAKINGKITTIDQLLQTGDIVEVLTTPTSRGPSMDWLKIVKTSQARNKINQWFKAHNRDANIIKGKEVVDKEMRKAEIPNLNEYKEKFADLAMKKFNIKTVDDMYAAIGFEGPIGIKIFKKLQDEIKKMTISGSETKPKITGSSSYSKHSSNGIIVKGIENCLIRLSKCCNPVPGDEIVGYITRGRGVSVHRKDCVNVTNATEEEKNRLIEVKWDETFNSAFSSHLVITAINRNNLLLEVSAELSNIHVPLSGINARVLKDGLCVMDLTVDVINGQQLDAVIKKLMNISGVFEVKRTNK